MITEKGRELARVIRKNYPTAVPRFDDPGDFEHTCSLICRHAVTLSRIGEIWCSVEMSERAVKRLERKESQLENRVKALVERIGCGVKFNGDPRGFAVKLTGLGTYSTWGGLEDGWGV